MKDQIHFRPRGAEQAAREPEELSHYLLPKIAVVTWRVCLFGITRTRCKIENKKTVRGRDTLTSWATRKVLPCQGKNDLTRNECFGRVFCHSSALNISSRWWAKNKTHPSDIASNRFCQTYLIWQTMGICVQTMAQPPHSLVVYLAARRKGSVI